MPAEIAAWAAAPLADLLAEAARVRDQGSGDTVSYSPKVFIPLTRACRDVCHYCTFARAPRPGERVYLGPDEVLAIARAGREAGCHEALFTLGDKPELRYRRAAAELEELGCASTIDYLARMCRLVLEETGLLPHANPGVATAEEWRALRKVSASQGIMLETASTRLCAPGEVHYGSPDKDPAVRLASIAAAGEARVPFTSGILIGIGETRAERIESLLALKRLHEDHGHLQEIIVQNFRKKPGTRRAEAPEPDLADLLWTIAMARIVFGPDMAIQAPPNLSPGTYPALIGAGLNDWGGISPVTPDHVNPEARWPAVAELRRATEAAGKRLAPRLPVYPRFVGPEWLEGAVLTAALRATDASGWPRQDSWAPGLKAPVPAVWSGKVPAARPSPAVADLLEDARAGARLDEAGLVRLFEARGREVEAIAAAADDLRHRVSGDTVRYVVNRNINYTNVCGFKCRFCAFSKGRQSQDLRGTPYDLDLGEIARRTVEAHERGATEVCLQGGIHPDYTGATYLAILGAVKEAVPAIHVHAFSPLEVMQGASTLGLPVSRFLRLLRDAGLGSLPGTAAEILDDEVRATLCPDKLTTAEWLAVVEAAHEVGLRTTATIMFGHVERPVHWARHLLRIRDLQARTGGFTEFVPLPFVHMEAPIYFKGAARQGPTFREVLLMHSVARLALHPVLPNIQTSWVKLGPDGVAACLRAGANDLGGTLMNESISRAAGTLHGQEFPPAAMDGLIESLGRRPGQRTTLYGAVPAGQQAASYAAAPLEPVVQPRAGKRARIAGASLEQFGAAS